MSYSYTSRKTCPTPPPLGGFCSLSTNSKEVDAASNVIAEPVPKPRFPFARRALVTLTCCAKEKKEEQARHHAWGVCFGLKKATMNTASKLGPHAQTDLGTCPGGGL
jgi:hypothetical protein